MKQLTVRGFDPALERRLRQLARTRGISLNRAALLLMRQGAGLAERAEDPDVIGASLDRLIGSWTDDEADEFDDAIHDFDVIDEELWR